MQTDMLHILLAYGYGPNAAVPPETVGGSVEQCGSQFKLDHKNTAKKN